MATIHIRQMTPQDIPSAMRLKTVAGWNQTEADWRLFLDCSPDGCYVAAAGDGSVLGTITTLVHGGCVAWIGMLLVDPAHRRQGIGTRLMRRAIEHLSRCKAVALDATPLGKPLYERLGFRDRYGVLRMTIDRLPAVGKPLLDVAPIVERTFEQLLTLDRHAFGADRSALLRSLWRRTPELAWYSERDWRVSGFGLGRRGTTYTQIGPVVAETSDDAITVCRYAMQRLSGQAVVLDVPTSQADFLAWLCERGFVAQRPFTRMALGGSDIPGIAEHQFAIAGPELG